MYVKRFNFEHILWILHYMEAHIFYGTKEEILLSSWLQLTTELPLSMATSYFFCLLLSLTLTLFSMSQDLLLLSVEMGWKLTPVSGVMHWIFCQWWGNLGWWSRGGLPIAIFSQLEKLNTQYLHFCSFLRNSFDLAIPCCQVQSRRFMTFCYVQN